MTQTIALASKFQPILDEIYKVASVTSRFDSPTRPVNFGGANVVEVFTTAMAMGLANYNRLTGYVAGEVTGAWETLTLAQQRGREFNIDRMDDEETLGMAFGTLAGEFIRQHVAPELDAYRFAKFAATGGNEGSPTTYTSSTIIAAIDAAEAALNADEVPVEGRVLFLSDTCYGFLKAAVTRMLGNENSVARDIQTFDGMPVVMVPQTRFYSALTITAGNATTGGFANNGAEMNYMIVHPSAVLQVTKHANLKIFSPEENQDMDAWKFQYRIYHDAFVYTNKVNGVAYGHK